MMSNDAAELSASVERFLDRVRAQTGLPGAGIAVSDARGRMSVSSGLADTKRQWNLGSGSRFGVACITKLLVAIIAHKMAFEGVIDLDEPIDEYNLHQGRKFSGGITIRHLLSHRGGYQGPLIFGIGHRKFNWEMFSSGFPDYRRVFTPGSVFNYENTGHVIIGEIIRQVAGRDVLQVMQETIFSPLGIIPGGPLSDYKLPDSYVSPHQINGAGVAMASAPSPFGSFWAASLADLTLTLSDFLSIGEAIVGRRPEVDFSFLAGVLGERLVTIPICASSAAREHSPRHFNAACAEYADGWFGYAGSALGQTCGLRFNPHSKTVCAIGMNAWVPIARDEIMDRLCGTKTHPEAGAACGNNSVLPEEMTGTYVGGGNLIRSVSVYSGVPGSITVSLDGDGLKAPPIDIRLDESHQLCPEKNSSFPSVGFFRDPDSGAPCILVGLAALKKVSSAVKSHG